MTLITPSPILPAPVEGYPTTGFPITNITPFTYRDGWTYLEKEEAFRSYIRDYVVPWMATSVGGLSDSWQAEVTALEAAVNTALATQATSVTSEVATLIDSVNAAVTALNAAVATANTDATNAGASATAAAASAASAASALATANTDATNAGASATAAAASAASAASAVLTSQKARKPVYAADYGTPGLRATLDAAIAAAEAMGMHTPVHFSGIWDVGNGLSLTGKSVVLVGDGVGGGNESSPTGTVFYASTQSGPVIDFSGWLIPVPGFDGNVTHRGFMVQGSNVADPTLNNSGLKFTALSSTSFVDIAIRHTGGPCIDMVANPGNGVYLCNFERITLKEPVSMNTNDVPFFRANECNGNRFRGFGLHSQAHPVGPSGAVQILNNASYSATDNLFDAWWFENTLIPNGGTLFSHAGNNDIIRDFQFFDISKSAGATGTSFFRMNAPTNAKNYGTNIISGVIPGAGGATDPDIGVDMRQSRNRVQGVKSYRAFSGSNVVIAAGILNTLVDLGGQYTPGLPAVVDNSGNQTNVVIDTSAMQYPGGGTGFRRVQSGRFYGPTNHTTTPNAQADGVSAAIPFWLPVATTFVEIDCQVTTAGVAGTLVRLGIYANDPSKDQPAALILDAGTIDGSTASMKSITLTPITLQAGLYWLSATPQGGAPTLMGIATSLAPVGNSTAIGSMATGNCYTMTGVSGALPAWSATGTPASIAPKIMLKTQ